MSQFPAFFPVSQSLVAPLFSITRPRFCWVWLGLSDITSNSRGAAGKWKPPGRYLRSPPPAGAVPAATPQATLLFPSQRPCGWTRLWRPIPRSAAVWDWSPLPFTFLWRDCRQNARAARDVESRKRAESSVWVCHLEWVHTLDFRSAVLYVLESPPLLSSKKLSLDINIKIEIPYSPAFELCS